LKISNFQEKNGGFWGKATSQMITKRCLL